MAEEERFDCGGEGCEECRVCKYLNFLEWCGQVAGGIHHSIERDPELDAYIERTYGVKP